MADPYVPALARPAGFWIRAVAALIDFVVVFLVQVSLGFIAARIAGPAVADSTSIAPLVWLFTIVFAGAYTTVLHALVDGQTIGKMLVSVRVVSQSGEPVLLGAALLRFVGYFASLAPLALGFLMAGLRHDKRALHDLISGTRVERVRAVAVAAPTSPPADIATTSDVG